MMRFPDQAVAELADIAGIADACIVQVPVRQLNIVLNWARHLFERDGDDLCCARCRDWRLPG